MNKGIAFSSALFLAACAQNPGGTQTADPTVPWASNAKTTFVGSQRDRDHFDFRSEEAVKINGGPVGGTATFSLGNQPLRGPGGHPLGNINELFTNARQFLARAVRVLPPSEGSKVAVSWAGKAQAECHVTEAVNVGQCELLNRSPVELSDDTLALINGYFKRSGPSAPAPR